MPTPPSRQRQQTCIPRDGRDARGTDLRPAKQRTGNEQCGPARPVGLSMTTDARARRVPSKVVGRCTRRDRAAHRARGNGARGVDWRAACCQLGPECRPHARPGVACAGSQPSIDEDRHAGAPIRSGAVPSSCPCPLTMSVSAHARLGRLQNVPPDPIDWSLDSATSSSRRSPNDQPIEARHWRIARRARAIDHFATAGGVSGDVAAPRDQNTPWPAARERSASKNCKASICLHSSSVLTHWLSSVSCPLTSSIT